jgi:hypothetical protein
MTEQSAPIPNNRPAIQDLVIADMEARKQIGLERYGTLLQGHNGRDYLRDLYEELLDACNYVRMSAKHVRQVPSVCRRWRRWRTWRSCGLMYERDWWYAIFCRSLVKTMFKVFVEIITKLLAFLSFKASSKLDKFLLMGMAAAFGALTQQMWIVLSTYAVIYILHKRL